MTQSESVMKAGDSKDNDDDIDDSGDIDTDTDALSCKHTATTMTHDSQLADDHQIHNGSRTKCVT